MKVVSRIAVAIVLSCCALGFFLSIRVLLRYGSVKSFNVLSTTRVFDTNGSSTTDEKYIRSIDGNEFKTEDKEEPPRKKTCFRLFWKSLDLHDVPKNCTYIVLPHARGGIGNNMFQIASLIGIAHTKDMIPVIKAPGWAGGVFDLPNVSRLNVPNGAYLKVMGPGRYDKRIETLDTSKNWYTDAYLQTWKYFIGIKHLLRSIFSIKKIYVQKAKSFIQQISKPGHEKVCIHARRGDMAIPQIIEQGFSPANATYVKSAIEYLEQRLNRPLQYIVVSNGMDWCKQNIVVENVHYSPFSESEVGADRALIRECDHMIVTSGTFGWWGGWFVNGTVVYYTDYPRKGSGLAKGFDPKDYYPKEWIGLP